MHPAARPRPGQRSRGLGARCGMAAQPACAAGAPGAVPGAAGLCSYTAGILMRLSLHRSAWGWAAPVGLLLGRAAPWPPQPRTAAHPTPHSPTHGAAAGTWGWGPGPACSPRRAGADLFSAPRVGSRKRLSRFSPKSGDIPSSDPATAGALGARLVSPAQPQTSRTSLGSPARPPQPIPSQPTSSCTTPTLQAPRAPGSLAELPC